MSVKLRMKNLAGGKKGLYLDIYHSGQRHYDFLKLYLEKGTSSRIVAANRETLELATQTNLTAAVYSGHLAARELQAEPQEEVPFLRERIQI